MQDDISLQLGALPTDEELQAGYFLAARGRSVRFLAPSTEAGVKTPDIEMDGERWEIKSPTGRSANTIKRAFKVALRQSKNVVFDLRYSKLPDKPNVDKLKKEFRDITSAKRLVIITKARRLIDLSK